MRRVRAKQLLIGGATAMAVAVVVRQVKVFDAAATEFHPTRSAPKLPRDLASEFGLHPVYLTAGGGHVAAWQAPSHNGAVVVLVHGSNADRSAMLDEAALLLPAGFGVLLLDLPGHGESDGAVHWNQVESNTLADVARALSQSGLRVGVYGFSMGGVVASRAAELEPKIEALALAATPSRLSPLLRTEFGGRTGVGYFAARLAYAMGGAQMDDAPLDAVGRMAPRPTLLVTSRNDNVVPGWMARELFAKARGPKRLLVSSATGHGGYARSDPTYAKTLVSFFRDALVQ